MIGVGHSPHSPEPNAGAMYGYICHEFFRNHFKLLQEIILLVVEEVIVDMNMIIAWLVSGVNDLLWPFDWKGHLFWTMPQSISCCEDQPTRHAHAKCFDVGW
jgi:hypothetical protein